MVGILPSSALSGTPKFRQGQRVPDENGELVSLDDRIKEMKSDPRYSDMFPQPEGRAAKGDVQQISENFDAIAAGKVEVE